LFRFWIQAVHIYADQRQIVQWQEITESQLKLIGDRSLVE
jgi:hypothetical protein